MPTAELRGLHQLKREMTRLTVAVARRLSSNATNGRRAGGQGAAAPADSGGRDRIWLGLSGYRLGISYLPYPGWGS
jgi:hypothetical protein